MRRIVSTPDVLSGAWRFEGTRLDVEQIVLDLELGADPEQLIETFGLTAPELRAAVAWCEQRRAAHADRRTG